MSIFSSKFATLRIPANAQLDNAGASSSHGELRAWRVRLRKGIQIPIREQRLLGQVRTLSIGEVSAHCLRSEDHTARWNVLTAGLSSKRNTTQTGHRRVSTCLRIILGAL